MNHDNDHPKLGRDMIFWFHDEEIGVLETSYDAVVDEEEMMNEENNSSDEERRAFWELQEELLQTALYRTTSFERKVRQAAKNALTELSAAAAVCSCRRAAAASCRRCGIKEMSIMLQNAGFNCVVCMSSWKSSPEIPAAGQHMYLEVVQSEGSKKGEMKVIIELNLRGEFEMARSSQEYNQLVAKLPQLFVGKVERLRNLVKILCGTIKKCMKERKMHVAPWRKYKYMQAKWQGKPLLSTAPPLVVAVPPPSPEKKMTMLSFDVVDTLHHSKAVAVI